MTPSSLKHLDQTSQSWKRILAQFWQLKWIYAYLQNSATISRINGKTETVNIDFPRNSTACLSMNKTGATHLISFKSKIKLHVLIFIFYKQKWYGVKILFLFTFFATEIFFLFPCLLHRKPVNILKSG